MSKNEKFIVGYGINYAGSLPKIPKASDFLRPIYEAFTNSLEAIVIAEKNELLTDKKIDIDLILSEQRLVLEDDNRFSFEKIVVKDTGIGFPDSEYDRFISLNDTGKGYSNRGTGRVQYLHFFNTTEITSIYADSSSGTGFKLRAFTLSKQKAFLDRNAIVLLTSEKEINDSSSRTSVVFKTPLVNEDCQKYEGLTADELKKNLLEHYLGFFCENRSSLPQITIRLIHRKYQKADDKAEMVPKIVNVVSITADDIPEEQKSVDMDLYYQRFNFHERRYEESSKKETVTLKGFRIQKDKLAENRIRVTSKGQVTHTKIPLASLSSKDEINSCRYLFLLSSKYFDQKDSDVRGHLKIPKKSEIHPSAKTQADFYKEKESEWIFLEDIQEEANHQINQMYREIQEKAEERKKDIEALKRMFLLKDESLDGVNVAITDSDTDVLKKIYRSEAEKRAKLDAELKHRIERLKALDTTSPDYQSHLETEVNELMAQIPLQNKNEISRYIARRKLVLELFEKIINRQTEVQGRADADDLQRDKTEALLHNLIFSQKSKDPSLSDLWLINEEFIYFQGSSEIPLGEVEVNGKRLFKKEFSEIEQEYFESGNGVKTKKRPDVLLFPEEGKCIILEFKHPDVDVSDYLSQVKKYASWIMNYSIEELKITKFYGHLIGENIIPADVIAADGYFEKPAKFDYLYCPHTPIKDLDRVTTKGSLYMEVIKYSVLLERAKLRNKIFIDKLDLNLYREAK